MNKAGRKRERILQRNRRRLWRGRVQGPYQHGSAEHPIDAALILEDGRGCSAWHCGTFAVPARQRDGAWCRYCGFTHKDQIVQQLQKWQEPGAPGTPGYFVRLRAERRELRARVPGT